MLTQKQEKIVSYIENYVKTHQYPPTIREIGNAVGLTSTSSVYAQIQKLKQMGILDRNNSTSRSIVLKKNTETIEANDNDMINNKISIKKIGLPAFLSIPKQCSIISDFYNLQDREYVDFLGIVVYMFAKQTKSDIDENIIKDLTLSSNGKLIDRKYEAIHIALKQMKNINHEIQMKDIIKLINSKKQLHVSITYKN